MYKISLSAQTTGSILFFLLESGSVKGPIKDTYLIISLGKRGGGKRHGGRHSDRKTDINQHAKHRRNSDCSL